MKLTKMLPTQYLLISMLLMLVLHFLFPLSIIIPQLWNLLGLLLLAAGVIINLAADSAFHKANTTVKPFQEPTVLLTDGAFRFTRNPMYLGFVLILIGIALLLRTLTPWLVIPIFVVLTDRIFIRVEEQMLAAKFGPAWRDYKTKVRRCL